MAYTRRSVRCCAWIFGVLHAMAVLVGLPVTASERGALNQEVASTVLEVGRAHRATIGKGEIQHFEMVIPTAGFWRVAAEQLDIDIELIVRDPEGAEIATVGSPLYRKGTVWWAANLDDPGPYALDVRAKADTAAQGEFEMRLVDHSDAPSPIQEAEQAMAQAGALQRGDDPEALRSALDAYGRSRALWRREGDRVREAETLYSMARILSGRLADEIPAAIRFLEQAADLFAAAGRTRFEAAARADIGLAHWKLGALDEADVSLERAVALFEALGDAFGYGTALNTRCMIQHSRGALRAALACYEESLARVRQAASTAHAAAILNNIGYAYDSLGEPQVALARYGEVLDMYRGIGNRAGEAQVLNNMAAVISRGQGDGERALAYYEQAREIYEALGNRRQAAAVLHNQGVTYRRLGNVRRASVFLRRALDMRREEDDVRGQVGSLNTLGETHWQRGEIDEARRAHEEALMLARRVQRRRDEGLALAFLGRAEVRSGKPAEGLEHLDEALVVLDEVNDLFHLAWAHHARGESLLGLGKLEAAESALERALDLRRQVTNRAGEAETLEALARSARDRGDLESAWRQVEDALVIVEDLERRLLAPEIRMSFFSTRASTFETAIEILMRRHEQQPGADFATMAFELSERSRARTLYEILGRPPKSGGFVGASTSAVRSEIDDRLDAKTNRLMRLRGRGRDQSVEAKGLELEIQALLSQRDVLDGQEGTIQRARVARSLPTVTELQAALGSDTVLLEYALGDDRSFLWWVDREQVVAFELPPRAEIDRVARELHRMWSRAKRGESDGDRDLARMLSRLVLGPVWDRIDGRRLAVVADGALRHLPFVAMPVPDDAGIWRRLLDVAEVVHLPSLSVLVRQRQQHHRGAKASRPVAIFADPIFDVADPRIGDTDHEATSETLPVVASLRSAWRDAALPLGRLPQSRVEADSIRTLAGSRDVWLAVDREASRSHVVDGRLGRYGTIHFATHGLVVEDEPELSGLALSMVDQDGRVTDGFLRLRDIYALHLSADLVVLSGCRTALGQTVRGEGMVGLSRAFQTAGAQRVVASSWWVEDRATAQLMRLFYEALWREHLRPAAALRQAQQTLRADPRFATAFHWASFVLQGDWQ